MLAQTVGHGAGDQGLLGLGRLDHGVTKLAGGLEKLAVAGAFRGAAFKILAGAAGEPSAFGGAVFHAAMAAAGECGERLLNFSSRKSLASSKVAICGSG